MSTDGNQLQKESPAVDPVIQNGKFFAIMGYFSVLCFVPLFLKRDNKFAQFHGRQGLILFILEVAASMLKAVPILGDVIFVLAWVVFGILSLVAIVKVLTNEYWEMPVICQIASKVTL
jgi:uncharacterized membrane protein